MQKCRQLAAHRYGIADLFFSKHLRPRSSGAVSSLFYYVDFRQINHP
ncbi:MAG: hypothetical protein AAFO94_04245 [Bacteroidota bacterium]